MRRILFLIAFFSLLQTVTFAQRKPTDFVEETSPNNTNFEVYSQKNGLNRRSSLYNIKKYTTINYNRTPVTYTPQPTGNTLNLMEVVIDPNGDLYFIDADGEGVALGSSGVGGEDITNELDSMVVTIGNGATSIYNLPFTDGDILSVKGDDSVIAVSGTGTGNTRDIEISFKGQPQGEYTVTFDALGEPSFTAVTNAGATNLSYTANSGNGIVVNSTGTDATIPLATTSLSGLIAPASQQKINYLTVTAPVDLDALASGGVATQLSTLTDVNTSTPTAGNILIADGTDWESVTITGDGTLSSAGALTINSASTTVFGKTRLATNAEAFSGTATSPVLTPASATSAFVPKSLYTAKGDAVFGDGTSGGVTKLGVGTDGQILTADAAEASGVKWADPEGVTVTNYDITVGSSTVSIEGQAGCTAAISSGHITITVPAGVETPRHVSIHGVGADMTYTDAFNTQPGLRVTLDNSANMSSSVIRAVTAQKILTPGAIGVTNPAATQNPIDIDQRVVQVTGGIISYVWNGAQAKFPNGGYFTF